MARDSCNVLAPAACLALLLRVEPDMVIVSTMAEALKNTFTFIKDCSRVLQLYNFGFCDFNYVECVSNNNKNNGPKTILFETFWLFHKWALKNRTKQQKALNLVQKWPQIKCSLN